MVALTAVGVAVLGSSSAQAALTAPGDGNVYRGDVPFAEDTGGRTYNLAGPGFLNLGHVAALSCSNVNSAGTGSNVTPNPLAGIPVDERTSQGKVTITRNADNTVVHTTSHTSNQNVFASPSPWNAQPFSGTWNTAGATAGMYTARSYKRDITRNGTSSASLSTCRINGQTTSNDALVSEVTFEYRPWEQRFKDTLTTSGGVDFNINSSKEFQISLRGNRVSSIKNAPGAFTVVKLPKATSIVLPSDPTVCGADLDACLPPTPPACESNPAACDDRLVVIDYREDASGDALFGFFDLETRAFVAYAEVGDSFAILKSAGELDEQIHAIKSNLATEAAKLGISLQQLYAMKVSSVTNGDETKLSLDEGLEKLASTGMTDGTTIKGGPALSAGVIVHLIAGSYKGTSAGPYKIYGSGTNAPAVPDAEIPELPAPLTAYGPLAQGLLQSGQLGLRQIQAKDYTGGQHIYALAAGLEPSVAKLLYLPTEAATVADKSIDFVGVPLAVVQGGVCNSAGSCAGIGFLTGAGASLYDSPVAIPPLLAP